MVGCGIATLVSRGHYKWKTSGRPRITSRSTRTSRRQFPMHAGKKYVAVRATNRGDQPTTVTNLICAWHKSGAHAYSDGNRNFVVASARIPHQIPTGLRRSLWDGIIEQGQTTAYATRGSLCQVYSHTPVDRWVNGLLGCNSVLGGHDGFPERTNKKRCAIYARVFDRDQERRRSSGADRVAKARGFQVTHRLMSRDWGEGDRPQLKLLMELARRREIDIVLVWRSTVRPLECSSCSTPDQLRSWGVDFISMNDPVDTTSAAGELVFTIFAAIAAFERQLIGDRVRVVWRAARERKANTSADRHCPREVAAIRQLRREGYRIESGADELGLSRPSFASTLPRGENNPGVSSAVCLLPGTQRRR